VPFVKKSDRTQEVSVLLFSIILSLVLIAPGDIVISEIMYNPDGPTLGDDDTHEWLELCNTGQETLSLAGMMVSDGNNQLFLDGFSLEPGARVVVAADLEAFSSAYGDGVPTVSWDGDWTKLSNGGDEIILYSSQGQVLDAVTYSDSWGIAPGDTLRSEADGKGSSLEKIVLSGPNDESNWQPSQDFSCPVADPDDGSAVCWGTPGSRNSLEEE
jgi:hypothetical protein